MASNKDNIIFEKTSFLQGHNSPFIKELYLQYLKNSTAVPESWREFFDGLDEDQETIRKEILGPSWAPKEKNILRLIHVSALGADKDSKSFSSRSKAEGEDAILSNFPKATVLRPSLIFGTEDKFFNRFASMARYMPILPIFGSSFSNIGKTLFQPVYVKDVVRAVIFSSEIKSNWLV